MPAKLPANLLKELVQSWHIDGISADELVRLFQSESEIEAFLPDGTIATDPRSGDHILFNQARAHRPHDNRPLKEETPTDDANCIICQGQTTGIVDAAQLSLGYTFINKNFYPVLFPFTGEQLARIGSSASAGIVGDDGPACGLHFLQWTSSLHDKDWHNMPAADRLVVMERLAALEEKLIVESPRLLPKSKVSSRDQQDPGWVMITKNFGRLVGGSLSHGHQQIVLSNVMPGRFAENQRFEQRRGETFSAFMLRENPAELMIKDYGPAVLLVPYFMRRPYDMMLLLKQTKRRYLHQLDRAEMKAVADGWRDAIRIMRAVMPAVGRETAYNLLTNNGPGAGLYFEFRPYTQEFGGLEQLGLLVCQANPAETANHVRQVLADL